MSNNKVIYDSIESYGAYSEKFDLVSLPKNITVFTNDKGLGRFYPDHVYVNISAQGGTNTTAARFHLGYTAPNYNDYISSGSITSASIGTYSQTNYSITFTGSVPQNSSLVMRVFTSGTVQCTGSIVVMGYHSEK